MEELASGSVSHLNDLLAVVVAHLQLALMEAKSPDTRHHLAVAERAARDGAGVVQELSRLSSADLAPPVLIDLNQLAAEVLDSTRRRWRDWAEPRGVLVDMRLEASPIPRVAGDPSLLREVLENFVLNAIDAMPRGGRATIKTWAANDGVLCSVSDTGTGMAPDIQRHALEPFFTTTDVKRAGLGLSVNYGIIRGHGGELMTDSAKGRGTIAIFRLPVAGSSDKAVVVRDSGLARLSRGEPVLAATSTNDASS